jgi:hypothetical protein
LAIVSHEYPHYSWVRSTVHPASDFQWPIADILTTLDRLSERHRTQAIADLRNQFSDPAQERSVDEDVQLIYRVVLRREPDKKGFQEYTQAVREGRLTREALIDIITSSAKFKTQGAKVLVVPDHPSFNASTLRYYAEAQRRPQLFPYLNGPIDAERSQMYDFVLVKNSGYQGPEFSTQYAAQIQAT